MDDARFSFEISTRADGRMLSQRSTSLRGRGQLRAGDQVRIAATIVDRFTCEPLIGAIADFAQAVRIEPSPHTDVVGW